MHDESREGPENEPREGPENDTDLTNLRNTKALSYKLILEPTLRNTRGLYHKLDQTINHDKAERARRNEPFAHRARI